MVDNKTGTYVHSEVSDKISFVHCVSSFLFPYAKSKFLTLNWKGDVTRQNLPILLCYTQANKSWQMEMTCCHEKETFCCEFSLPRRLIVFKKFRTLRSRRQMFPKNWYKANKWLPRLCLVLSDVQWITINELHLLGHLKGRKKKSEVQFESAFFLLNYNQMPS